MFRRTLKIALVAMGLLSLGLVAVLPTSVGRGGFNSDSADAVAACPIIGSGNGKLHVGGSTTVGPISVGDQVGFAAVNSGASYDVSQQGSGDGRANTIGANPPGGNLYDVGNSSSAVSASQGLNFYVYQVAGDEQVIVVSPDVKALYASQSAAPNITRSDLLKIYTEVYTDWNQLPGLAGLVGTHHIVPRARVIISGSHDDFNSLIGVDGTTPPPAPGVEQTTIADTGLSRLTTSADVAAAVTGGSLQVGYASLANLGVIGANFLTLEGVTPSQATYVDNSYVSHRQLNTFVPNQTVRPRLGPGGDDSVAVKADDIIRYEMSSTGEANINAEGFIPFAPRNPIPSVDVNIDGKISLGDLGQIAAKWGLTTACNHWIRADAAPVGVDHDGDGTVDISDINLIFSKWGQTGFVYP